MQGGPQLVPHRALHRARVGVQVGQEGRPAADHARLEKSRLLAQGRAQVGEAQAAGQAGAPRREGRHLDVGGDARARGQGQEEGGHPARGGLEGGRGGGRAQGVQHVPKGQGEQGQGGAGGDRAHRAQGQQGGVA